MGTRRHSSKHQAERSARRAATAVGGVALLVALGATVVVVALHRADNLSATRGKTSDRTAPAGRSSSASHSVGVAPTPALRLESTSPASGAYDVAYDPTVTVQLSAPLASGSPLPSISPS